MLAMCRTDPEVLADVLGHFVTIASQHVHQNDNEDENSLQSDEEEILDDIREALALARAQGVLPPVRIARILAGEGAGQFSVNAGKNTGAQTVPLSVALDYVGAILDDSRVEISRLKVRETCFYKNDASYIQRLKHVACALTIRPKSRNTISCAIRWKRKSIRSSVALLPRLWKAPSRRPIA
jgi:hypothetical protein